MHALAVHLVHQDQPDNRQDDGRRLRGISPMALNNTSHCHTTIRVRMVSDLQSNAASFLHTGVISLI